VTVPCTHWFRQRTAGVAQAAHAQGAPRPLRATTYQPRHRPGALRQGHQAATTDQAQPNPPQVPEGVDKALVPAPGKAAPYLGPRPAAKGNP
jgi:hypothetical protein